MMPSFPESKILEDPPLYSTETEAIKVAADNGYRLQRDGEGPWLRFGSTTVPYDVYLAYSYGGQWWLSVEHPGVGRELGSISLAGPGAHTLTYKSLYEIHRALDRVYHLSKSLPSAPLVMFEHAVAGLPRTTEVERRVIARVGQDIFRGALMDYWNGRCPLTGITDIALLRASHIVPWADCATDEMRLNVYNGLLLSTLWDAAFDAGLISFASDGSVLTSSTLSVEAARALQLEMGTRLHLLTPNHEVMLQNHRTRH